MIEINLLPESLRKAEGTPLPRFIACILGVILICGLGVVIAHFQLNVIPDLEGDLKDKKEQVASAELAAAELDELLAKIAEIDEHVNAVKSLYRKRVIWAKILWDLKQIMTKDSVTNTMNEERRYLWLREIRLGRDDALEIDGYASAPDQVQAFRMAEDLVGRMLNFQPEERPEVEEKNRIQADLDAEIKRWKEKRLENPDLPEKSMKWEKLEAKLAAIRDAESGRIALRPFMEFFDGNPVIDQIVWVDTPNPDDSVEEAEGLPEKAQQFKIVLNIKKKEDEGAGMMGQ